MSTYPSVIELFALDGTTGFQINGEAAGDWSGSSVASAGDVNGDGFACMLRLIARLRPASLHLAPL